MSGLQYITNMCSKDAFQQSLFCFRQFRLCLACSYQIPVLDNKLIITSFVGTKKEIFHIMNFFKSIAVLFTKCIKGHVASSSVFSPKVFFWLFSCLDHFLCEWWPFLPYRPRYWCSPNLNVFLMQGILVLLAWWLFFMEQLKSICALKIRQRIIRQDMMHVHVKH